ncbi:anthranilate synthase [Streptomyces filamentosus NRRL 15998]|uniref:anthranilate synthase n=1 Tax=Streptomyces filamentosus NRRL 15998 TaxID=457431 RepID=D6AS98_STRFL|nr:anthranilate synthase [Streptomyces filamentosus NRRL 15998]
MFRSRSSPCEPRADPEWIPVRTVRKEPAPMSQTSSRSASALIGRLLSEDAPPFALLRRRTPGRDHDHVELLIGGVRKAGRLADLPVGASPALALVPFRQIAERGFDVRDDGTPLSVLVADESYELELAEVLAALPAHDVTVVDRGFDVPDEEYADIVRRVIRDEIGQGEGANFVIRRTFRGEIPGFGRADALALFRRLLAGERGAYWTFVVHTGDRALVGASPEVHVRMSGGTVVMNPISGTYRYPAQGPTPESLLAFLGDRKESEELSMVVDEELKMMCTVGDMGGVVVGPRLKEMAHLAHTEYELRGKSSLDVRDVLRETMFAATVTGSPVQNACRVIERYESGGRGYYAGALALLGRDANGAQTLDSPILIRTADIRPRRFAEGAGRGHTRTPLVSGERGRRDPCQGGRGAGRPRSAAGPPGGGGGPAAPGVRPPGAGGAGRPARRARPVLAADAGARPGPVRPRPGGGRRGHVHRDAGPSAAGVRARRLGAPVRRAGSARGGPGARGARGAGPRPGEPG